MPAKHHALHHLINYQPKNSTVNYLHPSRQTLNKKINMAAQCIVVVAIVCAFSSSIAIAEAGGETSTKCECAAFADSSDKLEEGVKPLIVQNPMNVTCTEEDVKNCEELCIQLVKVGKERAPEILCEHVDHMKFKPSLWSRTCDGAWKYSGLTCEKTICCHKGKPVDCEE